MFLLLYQIGQRKPHQKPFYMIKFIIHNGYWPIIVINEDIPRTIHIMQNSGNKDTIKNKILQLKGLRYTAFYHAIIAILNNNNVEHLEKPR